MSRILVLALAIVAVLGAAAWFLGLLGPSGSRLSVANTVFDVDADGAVELTHRQIGDIAVLWEWDRDGDAEPEIVAYDAALDADGNLRATGEVTAWDIGADGVLEQGQVDSTLQQLLRSDGYREALAAAAPPAVELVDARTREFVEHMSSRYDDWRLAGFRMPILGASLPDEDRLLPGARRAYRFGIHQGFDMYPGHIGTPTSYGGPVVAARDGVVTRSDVDYVELTPEQYAAVIATSREAGTTPPRELNLLRGRQVWIDHGHGVVTRYCHLSGIAGGVVEGTSVSAGDIVGFVGNSGMEAATNGSESGAHLHFELRIDDRYLGEGLPFDQTRALAAGIFGLDR